MINEINPKQRTDIEVIEERALNRDISLEHIADVKFDDSTQFPGRYQPVMEGQCRIYVPINIGFKGDYQQRLEDLDRTSIGPFDLNILNCTMPEMSEILREGKLEETELYKNFSRKRKPLDFAVFGVTATRGSKFDY